MSEKPLLLNFISSHFVCCSDVSQEHVVMTQQNVLCPPVQSGFFAHFLVV